MTGTDLLFLVAGGLLVAVGVVAGALADRIRHDRRARRGEGAQSPTMPPVRARKTEQKVLGDQVVEALTVAGFDKSDAKSATWSCNAEARGNVASWTREALRVLAGTVRASSVASAAKITRTTR